MATDTATAQAMGVANIATGSSTGAAAIIEVTLGFKPRHVRVFNETDAILWEKYAAQADADCAKTVTAGTLTKDTSSAIILKGGGANDTYRGFQLSAALAANGKSLHWIAYG